MSWSDFWRRAKERLGTLCSKGLDAIKSANAIVVFVGWVAPLLPKVVQWMKIIFWAAIAFVGGCSGGGC